MSQAAGTTVPASTGPASTGPASTGPGVASRSRTRLRRPRVTLNDDGQPHPRENSLSLFTLVAGLVACILGFLANQKGIGAWAHVGATWLGLVALFVGLPAQLFSATRTERMLIVTGLVAAFVGVSLGLSHGGFLP
jgi:hypothetical protein